jgi:hypothetical protein
MNRKVLKVGATAAAALLLLSGCGGAAQDGEPAAPTPTHTAEAGEPALPQVAGYEYQDVEGSDLAVLEDLRAQLDAANVEEPGSLLGLAGHQVTGPDGADFVVMEIQVGPVLADDPMAIDALGTLTPGASAQEGAVVRVGTMGGLQVVSDDFATCSWTQGDLVFVVLGEDEDSVNAYAEALIQACAEM